MKAPGCLHYTLATPADEPELRDLLARQAMPGWIALRFTREPDVFLGLEATARDHGVLIARDADTGALVAMHERSTHELFVDGQVRRIGYLGGLRTDPALPPGHWRVRLLRDGFRAGRTLLGPHDDGAFDLTAIVAGNTAARRILERGLPGIPRYAPLSDWVTLALRTRPHAPPERGLRVRPAGTDDLVAVLDLLHEHARQRQFAPAWREEDLATALTPDAEMAPGISHQVQSLLIAERNGAPVGCIGLWDQRGFRQIVVEGYRAPLGVARPVVNAASGLLGLPRLPRAGEVLATAWLSHAVLPETTADAVALIEHALVHAHARGLDQVTLGLPPEHPAMGTLTRRLRPLRYRSRLYLVHRRGASLPRRLDAPVHPETALL